MTERHGLKCSRKPQMGSEEDDVIDEVMAWLPLPEPYKGE